MKKLLSIALIFMFVLSPLFIFGQDDSSVIDFENPNSVLTWLMPIITLGATWLAKKVAPFISGTITLIAVPVISTGLAYLGTLADANTSWVILFLAGLGSVFLNQLYRNITPQV